MTEATLTPADRRKLQGMIDRTARAHAKFYAEQERLNDWCKARYGAEPGDVDADTIIDAVMGGCGPAGGMDAEEFDQAMMDRV